MDCKDQQFPLMSLVFTEVKVLVQLRNFKNDDLEEPKKKLASISTDYRVKQRTTHFCHTQMEKTHQNIL